MIAAGRVTLLAVARVVILAGSPGLSGAPASLPGISFTPRRINAPVGTSAVQRDNCFKMSRGKVNAITLQREASVPPSSDTAASCRTATIHWPVDFAVALLSLAAISRQTCLCHKHTSQPADREITET